MHRDRNRSVEALHVRPAGLVSQLLSVVSKVALRERVRMAPEKQDIFELICAFVKSSYVSGLFARIRPLALKRSVNQVPYLPQLEASKLEDSAVQMGRGEL